MSGGPVRPSGVPAAPWIVVPLGVVLLVGLLVGFLFSMRDTERPSVPAPAPPMYLPTLGLDATASPSPDDGMTGTPSPSATHSPNATASPRPGGSRSAPPRPNASVLPAAAGAVTAHYQATASDRGGFDARLTVVNGSGGGTSWRVELFFTGNVKSIQASSASGLSVSTQGGGAFVVRGTGPLPAGESATVQLHFGRTGTGDRPGRCTVNGADCVIG